MAQEDLTIYGAGPKFDFTPSQNRRVRTGSDARSPLSPSSVTFPIHETPSKKPRPKNTKRKENFRGSISSSTKPESANTTSSANATSAGPSAEVEPHTPAQRPRTRAQSIQSIPEGISEYSATNATSSRTPTAVEPPTPAQRSRSRAKSIQSIPEGIIKATSSGSFTEVEPPTPTQRPRTRARSIQTIETIPEGIIIPQPQADMGPIKENPTKRKATDDGGSESKRIKSSRSESPQPNTAVLAPTHVTAFPLKPAVIEERNGEIEFRVVNNDNSHESNIVLSGLKCIFQKQLPKMPKDYIARLVYDRTHLSIAIVKKPLEVVGGITYRPFKGRQFAEIVFCAISSDQQVKGYGAHLMSHLKDYVKATSDVKHFLTYADNYAIGYFKKQGFTKEITLDKSKWMGYIKDYEGGTIMQCSMLDKVRYLEQGRMLLKQKEAVFAKIRAFSKSHIVHQPPKAWKNGGHPIDPMSIPAIRDSGWSPDMDMLSRQPRHGPNYNQLYTLLNQMQNSSHAWPFNKPVDKDDVADYYEVITEPMDLSTMEEKLENDSYTTPEEFLYDANLIFNNCRKYNIDSTVYHKSANKLEKYMWTQLRLIPEWSHLEP